MNPDWTNNKPKKLRLSLDKLGKLQRKYKEHIQGEVVDNMALISEKKQIKMYLKIQMSSEQNCKDTRCKFYRLSNGTTYIFVKHVISIVRSIYNSPAQIGLHNDFWYNPSPTYWRTASGGEASKCLDAFFRGVKKLIPKAEELSRNIQRHRGVEYIGITTTSKIHKDILSQIHFVLTN